MATHIKSTGIAQEVHPRDGRAFDLRELQAFVGGLIELIVLPNGRDMYINEEGLILGQPYNREASRLARMPIHGDVIVGTRAELGE